MTNPKLSTINVNDGRKAFGTACRRRTIVSVRPLARAVATKSSSFTSISDDLITIMYEAPYPRARVAAGSTKWFSTSTTCAMPVASVPLS
jgi:hypothetical protein